LLTRPYSSPDIDFHSLKKYTKIAQRRTKVSERQQKAFSVDEVFFQKSSTGREIRQEPGC